MLELKKLEVAGGNATIEYEVVHNAGHLRTVLTQDFKLNVSLSTGQVSGGLHLTELKADTLDDAREKMAFWCERIAAALRQSKRAAGDLPLFERRSFELEDQPLWLRQEYDRLVEAYVNAKTPEDHAHIEAWLDGHPMRLIRDMVSYAECAADRIREASGVESDDD